MSTAGATGAAFNAGVETGSSDAIPNSHLADALAELAAAKVRVAKAEANLKGVKASLDDAKARVAELKTEA